MKTAYVPGIDGFAIKVSPGFFDNPKLGLPSLNGLMMSVEREDRPGRGACCSTTAISRMCAPPPPARSRRSISRAPMPQVAAIFGAGVQARLQLEALTLVRPIEQARIWARDRRRPMRRRER